MHTETQTPIFEYTNYRAFLQSYFEDRKRKNPAWSYEAWAQKLGLKNNTSILKILNGQREAGEVVSHKFSEYFKFNNDERVYFEDLIRLSKAKKDARLAVAIMEKMKKKHPKSTVRFLNEKEFSAISHWWFYVIRQMTHLASFQNDPEWIVKQLRFKVPLKEIKKALQILLDLKLLKENPNTKKLELSDERLNTSDDIASEAIQRFHEAMLENAKQSIRQVPVEERQVSGITLSLSKEDLPEAKKLIQEFEEKFAKLLDSKNADTVYQLHTTFFPLIKSNNRRTKK